GRHKQVFCFRIDVFGLFSLGVRRTCAGAPDACQRRVNIMKWVTWEQVGVDRMACAWLITKYIDPEAEYLFVPAGQKPLPEGAEPFDIPGVRLSHHRGHCTFYTMLREYDLHDPVLQRIARVVDEADTVQEVMLEP